MPSIITRLIGLMGLMGLICRPLIYIMIVPESIHPCSAHIPMLIPRVKVIQHDVLRLTRVRSLPWPPPRLLIPVLIPLIRIPAHIRRIVNTVPAETVRMRRIIRLQLQFTLVHLSVLSTPRLRPPRSDIEHNHSDLGERSEHNK